MQLFSLLAGPHPRSLSLGDFAPRSGRGRFPLSLVAFALSLVSFAAPAQAQTGELKMGGRPGRRSAVCRGRPRQSKQGDRSTSRSPSSSRTESAGLRGYLLVPVRRSIESSDRAWNLRGDRSEAVWRHTPARRTAMATTIPYLRFAKCWRFATLTPSPCAGCRSEGPPSRPRLVARSRTRFSCRPNAATVSRPSGPTMMCILIATCCWEESTGCSSTTCSRNGAGRTCRVSPCSHRLSR